MGEEKEILLRGKVCAYLTCRLMGDPLRLYRSILRPEWDIGSPYFVNEIFNLELFAHYCAFLFFNLNPNSTKSSVPILKESFLPQFPLSS